MTPGSTFSHVPPPGGTSQASRHSLPTEAQAASLPIPATQQVATVVLPQFEQRAEDKYRAYVDAKRDLLQARGELAVVRDIANGAYDDAGTYAIGSFGAWRVAP